MLEIDLLKGVGRPPKPRLWQAFIWTLVLSVSAMMAALLIINYSSTHGAVQAQQRMLADTEQNIREFRDVNDFIKNVEDRRVALKATMEEVRTVVQQQNQWSPVLAEISRTVPTGLVVADVITKRNEIRTKDNESKYNYSLVIGVLTESDPYLVETFLQSLRGSSIAARLDTVRITAQTQKKLEDRTFLYFSIECTLKQGADTVT